MSRKPKQPGASDDGDSVDDLQQTYDSQSGDNAGSTPDPDATYESIQKSVPSSGNGTDDVDRTTDSADPRIAKPAADTASGQPATNASPDETYDSVAAPPSPDETYDSVAPPASPDETYDSVAPPPAPDETYDSLAPPPKNQGQSASSLSPDETYDSLPAPKKDLLDATHVPSRSGSLGPTGRSRGTVQPVNPTMAASQQRGQDDEFLVLSQTKGREHLPEAIGRYEIKRLLGEGAFGKVYQARDTQLDRLVAVKVAKSISGDTQVKRFVREARAAAQLRHPNIIPVYEYGLVDGQNIIVYEFVEGETLKSFMKRKEKPDLAETIEIVREIADGLNYAHEHGIIHRDMKPDNVLIDPTGHPHIADFGCARSIDDQTHLTIDGSILGTPMYMSPEQASGRASFADGRTDIWSLGVMLYEMVSGQRPFQGQLTDLLYWICNNDPASLRKISPETPIDIETLCNKCLTRDLDKRFPSANILAEELARFQRGEPIKSRRIGTVARTWMWAKRNRAVASLLATVAVTLMIGTIVSSAFAFKAYSEQRKRAFAQMNAITTSEANALPGIFAALVPYRSTVLPQLKDKLAASETTSDERHRLRMAIIELEPDPVQRAQLADDMVEDLLVADPRDFFVCRECLKFRKDELTAVLWDAATDISDASTSGRRFRAAAALALYDPESPNWESIASDVAGFLTSVNQVESSYWLPSLELIRESLKPTLVAAYLSHGDEQDTTSERAAAILARMFTDQVKFLVDLVPDATPSQVPFLTSALQISRTDSIERLQTQLENPENLSQADTDVATQKSNLIAALIQLGDDFQWHHFTETIDRSVASELIERLGPSSTSFELLAEQVRRWKSIDSNLLSGILLSMGRFRQNQILDAQKMNLLPVLMAIFSEHSDSRVHSSARWLLDHWDFTAQLTRREKQLRRPVPDPNMNWHVDPIGNTFAIFGPVDSFEMGLNKKLNKQLTPQTGFEISEILNEPLHRKKIPRRFGICIHEVTIGQYEEFEAEIIRRLGQMLLEVDKEIASLDAADETSEKTKSKMKKLLQTKKRIEIKTKKANTESNRGSEIDKQLPIGNIDFFSALAYCRWTSEQMQTECGLPSIENLLQFFSTRKDFKLSQSHLDQLGYRLPTATEWEFACRGGSQTLFPFGSSPETTGQYAWFATNSGTTAHPVGQLMPGNTGLFDILGNVSEWCLDWYREDLPPAADGAEPKSYVDFGPELDARQSLDREFRGGSFADEVFDVRSTKRFSVSPMNGHPRRGFRLARTYEPSTSNVDQTTVVDAKE